MPTNYLGKPFELHSAGIDYATFTTASGPRAYEAYDKARHILEQETRDGNPAKPWRSFGYLGWASSHVTLGRRPESIIVRLSGELADHYWRSFRAMCDRCTRLDLAVTACCNSPSFNVAHLSLREARAWKRQHDSRYQVGYQFSDPGGQTVTLGARSSEKYGRIYDKYAESGPPYQPGTWRWELEVKGDTAQAVSERLFGEPDRRKWAGEYCLAYFAQHGVSLPFKAEPVQWRYTKVTTKLSVEAKLEYLRTSIKPMVREVALAVGEKTVLDVLGLWPDDCGELGTNAEYHQVELDSGTGQYLQGSGAGAP